MRLPWHNSKTTISKFIHFTLFQIADICKNIGKVKDSTEVVRNDNGRNWRKDITNIVNLHLTCKTISRKIKPERYAAKDFLWKNRYTLVYIQKKL